LDKRDLFKEGSIALEALSETTNGDADSVVMDPACQLPKFFEAQSTVNSADESDSTVFSIEPHAVADIKPMKRFAEVGLSALQLEMVVVYPSRRKRGGSVTSGCRSGRVQSLLRLLTRRRGRRNWLPFGPGGRHKIPVRQRFQELNDLVLLGVGQAQVAKLVAYVLVNFWRGPIGDSLSRFARWFMHASVQSIASVVEVDNCLQTLEVTVMPVRLHEIGAGPLVYVPQSRDLPLNFGASGTQSGFGFLPIPIPGAEG
jgi:hypothetical protein